MKENIASALLSMCTIPYTDVLERLYEKLDIIINYMICITIHVTKYKSVVSDVFILSISCVFFPTATLYPIVS